MARQAGDGWSKARIETLTQMAAAGFTAADVAVQLATSRSAVLGKANRLGIRFGAQDGPRPDLTVDLPPPMVLIDSVIAVPDTAPPSRPRKKRAVVADADMPGQAEGFEVAPDLPAALPACAKDVDVPAAPAPLQSTPKGWPKPAGPSAVGLLDLRGHHCRMPLWGDAEKTGLFCGEPAVPGRSYCAACRPLIPDARQGRTVQERAANSAKFTAAGRTGAFT